MRPLQSNFEAVLHLPVPTGLSSLRSFLGLVGFYAKFIPNFVEVEPLRRILRGKTKFARDAAAEQSFAHLKEVLSSRPALSVLNPDLPVVVTTDASAQGLGAVLQQVDGERLNTAAFAPRTLSTAEISIQLRNEKHWPAYGPVNAGTLGKKFYVTD